MAAGALGKAYDATWGRVFARCYDRALKATEENGLGAMRAALLAAARGRVVEIGAGTGVNVALYGEGIDDLTLVEPDPHMAARLRARLRAEEGVDGGAAPEAPGGHAQVAKQLVEAPAEALPFADDTFDTAVATLVLCTIPDPVAAIDELARVLVPGGRLLFIEHVRSDDPDRARWQDRLEKPWRFMADGCYCNRDTEATLGSSPFVIETIEHGKMPKAAPIVRPLIRGTAVLGS
ncbi:MAG TPA: class I SAM-dependent methyltransferase [Solirubrobacterales bacterium]|nr:class I SAM-dependent methyltransferase [Solirubrobacterales bacterium]